MKGILLCAECAYYSMAKHKCTIGAIDEGDPAARFYADCPLVDVAPVIRCKDCKYYKTPVCHMHTDYPWEPARDDDFCSRAER